MKDWGVRDILYEVECCQHVISIACATHACQDDCSYRAEHCKEVCVWHSGNHFHLLARRSDLVMVQAVTNENKTVMSAHEPTSVVDQGAFGMLLLTGNCKSCHYA